MQLSNAYISIEDTGVYVIGWVGPVRMKIKTTNRWRQLDSEEEEVFSGPHDKQESRGHWVYFPISLDHK